MAYRCPNRLLPVCWLLLLSTISCAAFAQQSGCNQAGTDTAGLRVYLDPQTGELLPGPPPGTAPAADAPAAGPRPELVEEIRPDGSVMVRLDDRFQTPLQAELKDDQLVSCHGDQHPHD